MAAAQLIVPTQGLAQTAPAATMEKKPEAQKTPESATEGTTTVTVEGKKRTDPAGKEIYDVTKNPDAATGTAADALNKVPGVNVDAEGAVTLRGQNARVYLNGRPSLMLSGDNRAAALQSMPSAYISTIEVISNPGAQYSSNSSGPIINIVTKRNMPPGMFGGVTAQASSRGGGNLNANFNYTKGKLNLSGFGGLFDSRYETHSEGRTESFDIAGVKIRDSESQGEMAGKFRSAMLTTNLQYDIGPNDVLTGALSFNKSTSSSDSSNATSTRGADGALTDIFTSRNLGRFGNENGTLVLGYTHYGQKPDQSLKLDLSLSQSNRDSPSRTLSSYERSSVIGNTGDRYNRRESSTTTHSAIFNAAYNTTFGRTQVSVGAQIDRSDSEADNLSFGPASSEADLVLNALLSNRFRYDQTASALYGTAQWELTPKWTLLAGLRAEALDLSTEDPRSGLTNHVDYVRLNPSLFATYAFTPKRRLRLSYTHKQQRPEPNDLNPRLIFGSATSVSVGNADLGPEEADNLEVTYEVNGATSDYSLRGFYRFEDDTIVTSTRIIPDPQNLGNLVTETTRANDGQERNYGLTATYSKRWDKKLTLNLDATVTFIEMDTPNFAEPRSDTTFGGGVSANYTLKNGSVSVNYKMIGRRFTTQGYTESYGQGSISYRRNLTPKVSLVVTVQDPLPLAKTETITETTRLRSRYINDRETPTVMVGLSRRFGGFTAAPKKP